MSPVGFNISIDFEGNFVKWACSVRSQDRNGKHVAGVERTGYAVTPEEAVKSATAVSLHEIFEQYKGLKG